MYWPPSSSLRQVSSISSSPPPIHCEFPACLGTRLRSGLISKEQAWDVFFPLLLTAGSQAFPELPFWPIQLLPERLLLFYFVIIFFHPGQPFQNTLPVDSIFLVFPSEVIFFSLALFKAPVHSRFWPSWHYCHRFLSFFFIYFSVTQVSTQGWVQMRSHLQ